METLKTPKRPWQRDVQGPKIILLNREKHPLGERRLDMVAKSAEEKEVDLTEVERGLGT